MTLLSKFPACLDPLRTSLEKYLYVLFDTNLFGSDEPIYTKLIRVEPNKFGSAELKILNRSISSLLER